MKDAQQFLADIRQDKDLAAELEALATRMKEQPTSEEDHQAADLEALVAFAREHGYQLEAEDLALQTATNREVDDAQLDTVSGGGRGSCMFKFGCILSLMNCFISDECSALPYCNDVNR
ncbi:MAG: Nif11-like leader peptide family natural product precursor [Coriobacteriia bacterium]|nr:Nif11-like leader peptide family natural product precursor [Coriobacteriia bacterium]